MSNLTLLAQTLAAIDEANSRDPHYEDVAGTPVPKELLYGQRMSERLNAFAPAASEQLQIAARGQHIERWVRPREDYPEGRTGYKKWRAELGLYHAQRVGDIMDALGWAEEDVARVRFLIQKRQLRRDEETQTLEDVVCLVFLEHYLDDFARKHAEPKLIDIIQKTWKKMSAEGHAAALQLALPPHLASLINKALT